MPSIETAPAAIKSPAKEAGAVQFVFLDKNDHPTTNDIGKLAMYTENDKDSKGLITVATLPNNSLEDDMAVRVVNNQNKSDTSFFYDSEKQFPNRMTMMKGGERIEGTFSEYDDTTETFSLTLVCGNETEVFEKIILNKNVFTAYKADNSLTDTQNARASAILTTIMLWASIALQFDNRNEGNELLRWGWDWVGNFFTGLFVVTAVVATAVLFCVSPPAAIAITSAGIQVSLVTTAQIVAASVAIGATVGAAIVSMLPKPEVPQPTPPQPKPETIKGRPIITITHNGVPLENNGKLYYLERPTETSPGESVTFDVKITSLGEFTSAKDVMNVNNMLFAYDPNDKKFVTTTPRVDSNSSFFNQKVTSNTDDSLQLIITRNERKGSWEDGTVQFVLWFYQPVIINGELKKGFVAKKRSGTTEDILSNQIITEVEQGEGYLFLLNFTVLKP